MSDVKRVVVVRKVVPKTPVEIIKKPTKAERKAYGEAMRAQGKKFCNFWWDESLFGEFAKKCEASGMKPNDYLWSLIKKDMGWPE